MKAQTVGTIQVDLVAERGDVAVDVGLLLDGVSIDDVRPHKDDLHDECMCWTRNCLRMSFHSYLLRTESHTILVDTCCGDGRIRAGHPLFENLSTDYLRNLERLGIRPEEIDIVFCTHLHVDHVGWNTRQSDGRWVPTFPNARYVFGKQELESWTSGWAPSRVSAASRAAFADSVLPILELGLAEQVANDATIVSASGYQVELVHLPGHTPGHTGVHLRSGGHTGLLTGDAIHHPVQLARPDWCNPADIDRELATRTRRQLIETYADNKTLIFPGHFCAPTAGRIVSTPTGHKFDYVPA